MKSKEFELGKICGRVEERQKWINRLGEDFDKLKIKMEKTREELKALT